MKDGYTIQETTRIIEEGQRARVSMTRFAGSRSRWCGRPKQQPRQFGFCGLKLSGFAKRSRP